MNRKTHFDDMAEDDKNELETQRELADMKLNEEMIAAILEAVEGAIRKLDVMTDLRRRGGNVGITLEVDRVTTRCTMTCGERKVVTQGSILREMGPRAEF